MCGLNGSGQCAITAPAGTRDLSEYKTIVRPTLINMPVFDYNTSGGPTSSQKGGSGSSKYVTVPSASSPLGSLGSRVFPFNLGFGGSSQKNSGVQFCGDIEIVLGELLCFIYIFVFVLACRLRLLLCFVSVSVARHHTTMLHVPTNRLYAWGSTLYGQLGVSSLSNTDTVNVQNIGIGSGNSSAQARRRLSVPQEIHVASVTGGVPVTVTGLKGGGLEDICTITGCLQSVGGGVSVLTYAVGLACGEHHNLMLTSSLPLTEAPRDVTTGPSTKDKDAPPVYMMVPSADGGPCEYSPLTQLYSWGYNLEGQCGHSGSVAHVKSPRSIEFFNPSNNLNIRSIHCGYNQCLVVATNTLGATRPAPVLTPGCLSAVPSKRESMLEANPTHGGSAEGSMIFGWGYADGGWMGAVTPNPDTLPYIDPDNLVPGGQYPHSQARMFDCNCILLTPTRIKSMVPNIYSTRPSSATIGIGASGSASTEASMSSKSFGNYDTVSENVPSSPGCYVPKAIRCGYTHTVVFLQHCEGTVSGSGSQQTGAKRHFVAGTGAEISDDSDDGVNSKADSKSAKEKGVKGGLFGKSSALVGKLSGKNSRAVSPVPTPAASHQQQMELLFHIAKRHCVPGQPDGVGLLDAFSAALRGLLAANVNVDLLVDAADDDNTLLISACKYLTRSANGHTASAQGTRLQLFHIIKHIVGTCVYVESNSGAVSIINAQNKGGNSALHYCFGAHKHEDITPSEASMISGHTLGEYLLSLNDTSLHTTLRDIQLEIKLSVNDLLTNAHGLTCYEGITPEDLEQL